MPRPTVNRTVARIARLARGEHAQSDSRGALEELAQLRRRQVYREDVEFAPEDEPTRAVTAPEDLERIRELRAQGLSYLVIASELGLDQNTVGILCRRYDFPKGEPVRRGKRA